MAGYLFAAGCVVLLCACYRAGRAALPPRRTAAIAAGAACVPAAQFAFRPAGLSGVTGFVSAYLVFALLPLLAGRYVSMQRRAIESERLRERLGIARQMHDSLGRRLSLAAVRAAALEVSGLPEPQRAAVARLGTAIRASVTELHEILGVLRAQPRGMPAAGDLIEEFRAAGVTVSVSSAGTPRPAGEAAYRVIEEGLTNAARHAPGRPVAITIAWEADTLELTVANPAGPGGYRPGSGLADLAERVQRASGCLGHEMAGGEFRLRATLPAARAEPPERSGGSGLIVGILLLVVLPLVLLAGVS